MPASTLRWEKQSDTESHYAYCGQLMVGMVVRRSTDGQWVWSISAVHMKWIGCSMGETVLFHSATRALERNWRLWLDRAGLTSAS